MGKYFDIVFIDTSLICIVMPTEKAGIRLRLLSLKFGLRSDFIRSYELYFLSKPRRHMKHVRLYFLSLTRDYRHETISRFHKINSSRPNQILADKIMYYNAYSY